MRSSDLLFSSQRTVPLIFVLVAVTLVTAAPLWAGNPEAESKEVEKTRIIRVTGPGGHAVAHGFDVMGSRGYLGVETIQLTPELREHFGAPGEIGVMVSRVAEGSPAQSAGLQVGDVLTAVDDEPIGTFIQLFHEISRHEEGEVVRLEVWRNARVLTFDAALTKLERPRVDVRQFHIEPGGEHHTLVLPDGDFDEVIELRTEAFDEAIERLNEELSRSDWQGRLHSYGSNQEELLERLEALENRLRELEGELNDLGPGER